MKPLHLLNTNLLFFVQIVMLLIGAIGLIYLVYYLWKK